MRHILEVHSVVIVKLGSLGDIVHALPLANALKDNFPDIHIGWVVEKKFYGLLESHPAIEEAIVFDRQKSHVKTLLSFINTIRRIRSKKYDILIDLQGSLKGILIVFFSGCSRRMGFRRGSSRVETASTLFTNWKVAERGTHIIDRNLYFAGILGAGMVNVSFKIPLHNPAVEDINKFLRQKHISGKRIVILHPGVTWVTKRWPLANYIRLAEEIAKKIPEAAVVVSTGPEEKALGIRFKKKCKTDITVADNMSLPQLAALLDACEVFVGSDTGPLHLAAALGKMVIGLYGPTDPGRNGPYGKGNFVVSSRKACAGCWRKRCPDISCMNDIKVSDVMERVIEAYRDLNNVGA